MSKKYIAGYEVEDNFIGETYFATVNDVRISNTFHDSSQDALQEAAEWVEDHFDEE